MTIGWAELTHRGHLPPALPGIRLLTSPSTMNGIMRLIKGTVPINAAKPPGANASCQLGLRGWHGLRSLDAYVRPVTGAKGVQRGEQVTSAKTLRYMPPAFPLWLQCSRADSF